MDIEKAAQDIIKKSDGIPILFIALPRSFGQPPDQSQITLAECDGCKFPVQSTVIKDRVRELTRKTAYPARLLCAVCMLTETKDTMTTMINYKGR